MPLSDPVGVKIIFRVALVLLRHTLGSVEKLRSCQGMYETMEQLRNLPPQCMQEDFLVHEVGLEPQHTLVSSAHIQTHLYSGSRVFCLGNQPPSDRSID